MLGKLMKYEFKALARVLLPLYGAVLLLSAVGHPLVRLADDHRLEGIWEIFTAMFFIFYILTIAASVLLTLFLVLQRFYKSMVCDEGYLTHTLPVTTGSLVGAKLLTGSVWMLVSAVNAVASLVILFFSGETWQLVKILLDSYGTLSAEFAAQNGISLTAMLAFAGGVFLIALPTQLLIFYAAISIGQLMNRQKLLGAVGGYLALYMVGQMLSLGVLLLGMIFSGSLSGAALSGEMPAQLMPVMMTSVVLVQLVMGGGCWLLTHWIMSRKLNLE